MKNIKYTIPNIKAYVSEMSKAATVNDKLWFLKYVWVRRMVEIGTGGGAIPITMATLFDHEFEAVCYDPNPNLLYEAKQFKLKYGSKTKGVEFYGYYDNFTRALNACSKADITVLSSVLHEVYSGAYSDGSREKFWNLVRLADSDYVAIRDMCLLDGNHSTPSDILTAIRSEGKPDQIKSYERVKSLSNFSNAVEFLLKYRYKNNWEREVKENYLSVNWNEVAMVMELYGYERVHERYFTPPFIRETIKEDFGIDMVDTHCELLYKKKI